MCFITYNFFLQYLIKIFIKSITQFIQINLTKNKFYKYQKHYYLDYILSILFMIKSTHKF